MNVAWFPTGITEGLVERRAVLHPLVGDKGKGDQPFKRLVDLRAKIAANWGLKEPAGRVVRDQDFDASAAVLKSRLVTRSLWTGMAPAMRSLRRGLVLAASPLLAWRR